MYWYIDALSFDVTVIVLAREVLTITFSCYCFLVAIKTTSNAAYLLYVSGRI
jgi:hypothetical protein